MQSILSAVRLRQVMLRLSTHLSDRAIARDLHIGRYQLRHIRKVLIGTGLDYDHLMKLEDEQLLSIVYKVAYEQCASESENDLEECDRKEIVIRQIDYYRNELNRSGVTLHVLWEEYAGQVEMPYGYGTV